MCVILLLTDMVNEKDRAMYEKFYAVSKTKQDNIIDAALQVFAKNGYKKSSVDEIVKAANISKGLIFYYFHSKKNLFMFLFDYCTNLIIKDIDNNYDFEEKDYFQRLKNAQIIKLKTLKKHPSLFDFLVTAYFDKSKEALDIISNGQTKAFSYGTTLLFDGVAIEKFIDGIDINTIFKITLWTTEGYMKEQSNISLDNIEYIIEGLDYYLDTLRLSFYKGEYRK